MAMGLVTIESKLRLRPYPVSSNEESLCLLRTLSWSSLHCRDTFLCSHYFLFKKIFTRKRSFIPRSVQHNKIKRKKIKILYVLYNKVVKITVSLLRMRKIWFFSSLFFFLLFFVTFLSHYAFGTIPWKKIWNSRVAALSRHGLGTCFALMWSYVPNKTTLKRHSVPPKISFGLVTRVERERKKIEKERKR